jgi:hypothetical protein
MIGTVTKEQYGVLLGQEAQRYVLEESPRRCPKTAEVLKLREHFEKMGAVILNVTLGGIAFSMPDSPDVRMFCSVVVPHA